MANYKGVTTLGFAILSAIAREPLSGYDISRFFSRPFGFIWSAKHSQIYPELAKLQAAGLVSHEEIAQGGRPDKKIYRITDTGRGLLTEWVVRPAPPSTPRQELAIKTLAIWLTDPARAESLYRQEIAAAEHDVATLQAARDALDERHGNGVIAVTSPDFGLYADLQYGMALRRQTIDWCRWMLSHFDRASASATASGSPANRAAS